ncbi:MAG: Na/Pi cotransporter family protein [Peptococcaceae bacterium]|jgi:phosphate:Na+ symporter|nr:Na/Pi cotransporter family protein [Peptococcaceae bacterium]
MVTISMVTQFLGGLGLFLYGVHTTSNGLQKIAANKLKSILESLTKKTWTATLFGIVMTVALQSSAATTVMIVEFVNSGLMTLVQALGVSLGSSVGTSIVIQLISFRILDFALFLIFIGFILLLIVRTQLTRQIGQTLIGFGCIFVGMAYLSGAFAPLKDSPEIFQFLSQFGTNPLLGILISFLLTALIQSSAAFLAILISLSSQGLLTIEAIIPLVMGAHIGGTTTTLISSLGAERIDAKRVAIANCTYRVVATILLFPFFSLFAKLVAWSSGDLARQVANAHLFSAIFMVLVFLPFNRYLAKLLIKYIPQKKAPIQEPKPIYITKSALEVPTLALSQAHKEIRWIAHRILDNMIQLLPRLFLSGDPKWLNEMEKAEQQVDWHYNQLSAFLKDLYWRNMTSQQIVENHALNVTAKEFEAIADSFIVLARRSLKIYQDKLDIAETDWVILEDIYIATAENYLTLLNCLGTGNKDLAKKVIETQEKIIRTYNLFQGNIYCQLQNGCATPVDHLPDEEQWAENLSEGQKAILELGNWFYKIGQHMVGIARVYQNE